MKEKLIIIVLIVLVVAGLVWSGVSFFQSSESVSLDFSEGCEPADGYTDQEWQEHMSHHPERYKDCLRYD